MSWDTITADDVKGRFSGTELDIIQTAALADGQADPLPAVIAQAIDQCRGYIAARAGNTLGPAGTVPIQVRQAALAIIVWVLPGRLAIGKAGEMLRSQSRADDYKDAVSLLKDIAGGKMVVEQPETPGPETISAPPGKWGSNDKIDFTV
jgi:Protein of unknown function (DUF1320)